MVRVSAIPSSLLKDFNDGALRDIFTRTLGGEITQASLHLFQISQLRANISQMDFGYVFYPLTRDLLSVNDGQEFSYLIHRKAELATTSYEYETLHHGGRIEAMTAFGTSR